MPVTPSSPAGSEAQGDGATRHSETSWATRHRRASGVDATFRQCRGPALLVRHRPISRHGNDIGASSAGRGTASWKRHVLRAGCLGLVVPPVQQNGDFGQEKCVEVVHLGQPLPCWAAAVGDGDAEVGR